MQPEILVVDDVARFDPFSQNKMILAVGSRLLCSQEKYTSLQIEGRTPHLAYGPAALYVYVCIYARTHIYVNEYLYMWLSIYTYINNI